MTAPSSTSIKAINSVKSLSANIPPFKAKFDEITQIFMSELIELTSKGGTTEHTLGVVHLPTQ